MQREYDRAIASAERAVALNPGGARSLFALATAKYYSCRLDEAVTFYEQAMRLDPFPSSSGFRNLGAAYRCVGRYEESVKQLKKAIELSPNDLFAHISLAVTYVKLGRDRGGQGRGRRGFKDTPQVLSRLFCKGESVKVSIRSRR